MKDLKTFETQLAKLPYVLTLARMLGDYNLYVSSFFRNLDDVRAIVELIKSNANFTSFDMAIYRKDVNNPLIMPFVEGNPENSILYKIMGNTLQTR